MYDSGAQGDDFIREMYMTTGEGSEFFEDSEENLDGYEDDGEIDILRNLVDECDKAERLKQELRARQKAEKEAAASRRAKGRISVAEADVPPLTPRRG